MLRAARVGRLATADTRGRPLVVPVCFVLEGDAIYSAVDAKPKRDPGRPLRRIRNIEANPQAALVVDEYDEDWRRLRYVMAEGPTAILSGGEEFAQAVDGLREKYPQYLDLGLARERGTVIKLTIDRLLSWRFAEGHGPGERPPATPVR